MVKGLNGVDVGGQVERRLRLTHRQQPLRVQWGQGIRVATDEQGSGGPGVDVVGVLVPRIHQ